MKNIINGYPENSIISYESAGSIRANSGIKREIMTYMPDAEAVNFLLWKKNDIFVIITEASNAITLVTEKILKFLLKTAISIQYINKIIWFINVFKVLPPKYDKCNLWNMTYYT